MGAEIDPSTEEKEQRRFATVKRGYDRAQVDAFLVSIASSIDALEAELREFRATPSSAPTEAPHGTAERIEKLGDDAEREVEEMLEEARAEAAAIVAEAGDQADRITRDAQARPCGRSRRRARISARWKRKRAGSLQTSRSGVGR